MRPETPRIPVTRATLLAYLACFTVAFIGPGLVVRRIMERTTSESLAKRVDWFRAHGREYDLVLVGDSRTYCDLSPQQLDAELGTHSVNVGMWANWFFTQYPSLEDLLPYVGKDAVVVWSIGHVNFDRRDDPLNYPIGVANAVRYLGWGYGVRPVAENLIGLLPGLDVYAYREVIRRKIEAALAVPLVGGAAPTGPPRNAEALAALRQRYERDPGVAWIEAYQDEGAITSIALHHVRGHYERIEIDHAYFRRKQQELLLHLRPLPGATYHPDPARWSNFLAILDLFQRRHVRLIVNEVEEAPYNYSYPGDRRQLRAFMATVRAEVERRGIPYVRADWDQLVDADYFDWNHLNSDGIAKYTKLLAPLLRAELKP